MIARPILLAEALGTGVLLAVIVGSGWAVEQLGAAPATQLFIHAVVVGAGLGVAIAGFLPISGAQFNPAVTLALLARRELEPGAALQIMTAQLAGGIGGLVVANLMFASELMAVWTDPDFDPMVRAAYYVRVLEIPTPRWTTYDAVKLGVEPPKNVAATIQERAWSSPIWYTPEKELLIQAKLKKLTGHTWGPAASPQQ